MSDQYLNRAKELVCSAFNTSYPDPEPSVPGEFYVVWFAKTLGNWKALVSTDVVAGLYWEVTHNGAKGETYVDTYTKTGNVAVKDGDV